MAAASIQALVNPQNLPPYAGPVGTVEGVIHITGDSSPDQETKISAECAGAIPTYQKLFREGPARTLADVLVAVTGYNGYVPSKDEAVRVDMRECAYAHRTVSATLGQRIDVVNLDKSRSYIPYLIGDIAQAHMVAVQGGDPVRLYPTKVGRYLLVDEMNRLWMRSDVYVLKYATHAVTGLDGHYRIEGIPAGTMKIDAFLPSIDAVASRELTIEAGKTTKVDLELNYKKPVPPSGSSSATPKLPEVR
jgi:hypothetical protein